MLNDKTLKNLKKVEFTPYLKSLDYKNIRELTKGFKGDHNDYKQLSNFLYNELQDNKSNINKDNLNDFLTQKFFYDINNYHYLYNIDFVFNNSDTILLSKITHILNNPALNFNKNLVDISYNKKYDLLSTRVQTKNENGKEVVTNILFLMFIDEVQTKRGTVNFHCCIDIDLVNKFASFKFDQKIIENLSDKYNILDKLCILLQNSANIFGAFNIRLSTHNQSGIQKTIQKLFVDLSQQAEDILTSKIPSNTYEKTTQFLKDMNLAQDDEYIKQIVSVIYQDVSRTFSEDLFDHGWAFRFVFKEGDNTRASSSNDDFKPVYNKQVYWNLKELMFKENGTDFIESGFMWFIDEGKSTGAVYVKLEQKSNLITIQYYKKKNNLQRRKEKESYVLQKIRRNLQK